MVRGYGDARKREKTRKRPTTPSNLAAGAGPKVGVSYAMVKSYCITAMLTMHAPYFGWALFVVSSLTACCPPLIQLPISLYNNDSSSGEVDVDADVASFAMAAAQYVGVTLVSCFAHGATCMTERCVLSVYPEKASIMQSSKNVDQRRWQQTRTLFIDE